MWTAIVGRCYTHCDRYHSVSLANHADRLILKVILINIANREIVVPKYYRPRDNFKVLEKLKRKESKKRFLEQTAEADTTMELSEGEKAPSFLRYGSALDEDLDVEFDGDAEGIPPVLTTKDTPAISDHSTEKVDDKDAQDH